MAKKSMIQREIKRLVLFSKYKMKRKTILSQLKLNQNIGVSLDKIFTLQKKLQKLPKNSSRVRIRNRCWKTGRSRGVYRDFGLSRHAIREMGHNGLLPGLIKSSW
jgi:small subunit ribosomal protein S14